MRPKLFSHKASYENFNIVSYKESAVDKIRQTTMHMKVAKRKQR